MMELPTSNEALEEIDASFHQYASMAEEGNPGHSYRTSILSTIDPSVAPSVTTIMTETQPYKNALQKNISSTSTNAEDVPNIVSMVNIESVENSKSTFIIIIIALFGLCIAMGTALVMTSKIKAGLSLSEIIKQEIDSGSRGVHIKNFPSSYSIYTSNSENLDYNPVPLILGVPGSGPLNIATTISQCLRYTHISESKNVSKKF